MHVLEGDEFLAVGGWVDLMSTEHSFISLYKLGNGKKILEYIGGHRAPVITLAPTGSKDEFFSAGEDGMICRWSTKSTAPLD